MVNLMRKYQQTLLTIVTVIIIICFAWLYNDYRMGGRGGEGVVGVIYEKPIRVSEFQRAVKRFQICQELQMYELVGALAGQARTMDEAAKNFAFNSYVLRHEAEALEISPTASEVLERIKSMQLFQTKGAFDSSKYAMFIQNLGRFGFTGEQLEDCVRDELRVQKLRVLAGAPLSTPASELRHAYEEENQKAEVSFVRFKEEDIAKDITISDEDLKKAFEERKETFKSDELRKVKYVAFLLSDEEKKLAGKDRSAAFQKLVDKAQDFTVAMAEKDAKLEDVAKKFGVTVAETPEFPRRAAPAELGGTDAAANTAFDKLTLEKPNSDAIPSDKRDGYYVLQLTGITPSHPQTFDEVKTRLAETMKRERTAELLDTKVKEMRAKLDAELKAGKNLADAAKAVGLTAEPIPAFSQAEPPKVEGNPDVAMIARASADSAVGQLSEPLPVRGGRVLFRVEKRLPIDEAAFEKEKPGLLENFNRSLAMQAFRLWFAERVKAANLQTGAGEA
jgi:peptidyl-prolyl cis-trans isomerase D